MKKIYILTCVNENGDIVAIKPFKSEDEARADMKGQYTAELRDAEDSGFEDIEGSCGGNRASIAYGTDDICEYKWQVHETFDPVAEDAEADSMKERYIEEVNSYVKEKREGDVHVLDEPVDGYDSFYFDVEGAVIEVWNTEKRNYTSIFNIPTETAYKIAKMIDDGFYDIRG